MKWRSRASSSFFPPNWPCKCQTAERKESELSPVYLNQSSLISLHHCPLFCSLYLRQPSSEFISEPWPPLSHNLSFFHVILPPHQPFFCHSSPLYYHFFPLSDESQRKSTKTKWIWHMWCVWLWMTAQDVSFQQSSLFVLYIYIFFGPQRTVISFGKDGKRRNSSPPALSASVLCGPGHFGGLDKIFIPFNP